MMSKKPFNSANASSKKFPDKGRFFLGARYGHIHVLREFVDEYDEAVAWRQLHKTALMVAVENGHFMAAKLLLDHRADANAALPDGTRPLHAAAKGAPDVLGLLLHHRATIDAPKADGMTPLMEAVHNGSIKNAEALLRHGASVTRKNAAGRLPLHIAAAREYPLTATLLLDHGANINARDKDGLTPLMAAAEGGCIRTAYFLLERGADRHLRDDAGRTALDIACAHGGKDPEFVAAFTELIDRHNRAEAPKVAQPFTDGSDAIVKIRRPIKLTRRRGNPAP